MALKSSSLFLNGVAVVVYDYEKEGDTLPVHDHVGREWTDHFVIVCLGEFIVLGGTEQNPIDKTRAGPGDIVRWDVGTPHGFRAAVDGSRAIHIRGADVRDLSALNKVLPVGMVTLNSRDLA